MRHRHRVLLLLCLLSVITYLDRICIAVAGPRMQADLHIGPEAWGWIGAAFTLSYGLFEMPAGSWGDRIGPRRVLTRVILWWSAFTALTGASSRFVLLLIVRFCFGAGEAGAYPNVAITVSRWFPEFERARTLGVTIMCSQLGGALTPFVVVPLQLWLGWRAVFFLLGLLGLPWAVVWYVWFRDHPADHPGVSATELNEIGVAQGSSPHSGMEWRAMLSDGNLWKVVLVALSYGYGMYFYLFWLHTYLVKERGYSEKALLLTTGPFLLGGLANVLGGFVSDAGARRFGSIRSRRLVGVAGLGAAALFTATGMLTANKYWALLFLAFSYAGMAFQQPNVWAVCVDIGGRRAGAVSGFMNTGWNAGAFLSSLTFGYLVQLTGSFRPPLTVVAVVLALGALLWLTIEPSTKLMFAGESAIDSMSPS
jgi:MFS transporter, ACS family, glucarate transporter